MLKNLVTLEVLDSVSASDIVYYRKLPDSIGIYSPKGESRLELTESSLAKELTQLLGHEEINLKGFDLNNQLKRFFEVLFQIPIEEFRLNQKASTIEFGSSNYDFLGDFTPDQVYVAMIFARTVQLQMSKTPSAHSNFKGIILIDDLDNLNGPGFQKEIVPFFQKVFKEFQFILALNSPFVVQSFQDSSCFNFDNEVVLEDPSDYNLDALLSILYRLGSYSLTLEDNLNQLLSLSRKSRRVLTKTQKQKLRSLYSSYTRISNVLSDELSPILKEIKLNIKVNKHRVLDHSTIWFTIKNLNQGQSVWIMELRQGKVIISVTVF